MGADINCIHGEPSTNRSTSGGASQPDEEERMLLEPPQTESQEIAELQAQLAQAQRLCSLGALASSVAHELNNVLTLILSHAKLSLREKSSDEDRKHALDKILKSGERARIIIQGMLGQARRRSESMQPTRLAELVQNVLALTEKDLQKYKIQVELTLDDDPEVRINPVQIEQVVLNLILNARQAMPEGGSLRIRVRENRETQMAEISVADRGAGIPREKLRHIFDPFFTTKNPDEQGHGGTGLGLSVCRQIIEQHQGRIRAESLVGRGTIFTVKLPLTDASS